jgi:hypothetical protein
MLSFANPTLPEFSDDLLIAPAVEALQGLHGKPNTFSSYTTRRDTAKYPGKRFNYFYFYDNSLYQNTEALLSFSEPGT